MNKKILLLLCVMQCVVLWPAVAAVTIKKAAPVATQSSSIRDNAATLLPTVLGLVSDVQQLNAQQKALSDKCIPSSQEIQFVDNMMKEWAKTGAMTADEVAQRLGRYPCDDADGGYARAVEIEMGTHSGEVCFDWFKGDAGGEVAVWHGFPKVGKARPCKDGSTWCEDREKETVSDIYELFALIDFDTVDYTKAEATMAARLITKIDDCSSVKVSAKKREMWGNFLIETMGGVGQKTNTADIMGVVQQVSGGGGLSSLGNIATQLMNK